MGSGSGSDNMLAVGVRAQSCLDLVVKRPGMERTCNNDLRRNARGHWALECATGNRDHQQLAQKLVFCNSDLDKSTTVCKMGDLEYTRP
jgi:hypothetical protein